MSSTRRGFVLRQLQPPVVDIGCNCRKPKLFSIFSSSSSKPKSPNSSSTSTTTAFTNRTTNTTTTGTTTDSSWAAPSFMTNSLYEEEEREPVVPAASRSRERRRRRRRGRKGRVVRESVPVAVESSEPYEDFRDSMVQMVVEKEIYAWDDLNDLLHQFLSLNSPRHHPLILHAFADLWNRNGVFSPPSPCL